MPLHLEDPVAMLLVVDALREPSNVEAVVLGKLNRTSAREAARLGIEQIGVVKLPPGALITRAFGRHRGKLGSRPEDDEMPVLIPGDPAVNQFFHNLRLSLSRESAATWSLKVGILDNQHRGLGIADHVPGERQSLAMAELNDAGLGARLY